MACDGSGVVTVFASYPGDYDYEPCLGCDMCKEENKEDALFKAIELLLDNPRWTEKALARIIREGRTGRKG